MPMLGDILAAARDGAGQLQAWLNIVDHQLAGRVETAAADQAMTPTSYVRAAMADFSRFASEEDWATLTSTVKRTDDPGTACLLAMIDWRLTTRACAQHSHDHETQGAGNDRSDQRST